MATPLPLVVIVEDDLATATALGRLLRLGGFETAAYLSAESFLASPPSRRPLCLVLDVRLTGMSGIDLQRRLRLLGSELPVVFMTGLDNPRVRDEAERDGCIGFLSKDAQSETLLDLIRTLPTTTKGR
jgi:FixJ family two-component response regulator